MRKAVELPKFLVSGRLTLGLSNVQPVLQDFLCFRPYPVAEELQVVSLDDY
jgi:hypothetical protein